MEQKEKISDEDYTNIRTYQVDYYFSFPHSQVDFMYTWISRLLSEQVVVMMKRRNLQLIPHQPTMLN